MQPNAVSSLITFAPAVTGVAAMSSGLPRGAPHERALDALIESGLATFLVLDGSRITYVSPAFLALVGWDTSRTTRPAGLSELLGDEDSARVLAGLAGGDGRHRDLCVLRTAASEIHVALDAATVHSATGPRSVVVATDVTAWARSQERLERMAFEDALTGLANRALLHDRIELAIATARRNAGSFAVLLIDLDRFKPINDVHGHATGDLVLRETARRIQGAARAVDTVARLGGDEFVVLLGGDGGRDEAGRVVERILHAVTAPLPMPGLATGASVGLGASVGIAVYPDDGFDAEQLLARADGAMYDAKERGGNLHAFAESVRVGGRAPARLEWSARYLIGVEEIDAQHEELVSRMNALWEALPARRDRATLSLELAGITDLLESHFATEEACMVGNPHTGIAAHRADHARALETARSLAARTDDQGLVLGIRFLYDWLLSHIRSYDAELQPPRSG